MLRKTGTVLLMALLIVACGGGEPAGDDAAIPEGMGLPDDDVRSILAMDRAYQDAMAAGDWELIRELYANDAVFMPAGAPAVEGVDAIVAFFVETGPEGGMAGFNTDTDVIHGDATIGYHRGTWVSGAGDDLRRGKYLWVLRRMPSGEWRIVADMFNLDDAD